MKFVSRREDLTFHSEGECDASFVSKYLGRQDWGDAAESDGFPGRLEIGQDTLNLGIHSHVSSWKQHKKSIHEILDGTKGQSRKIHL